MSHTHEVIAVDEALIRRVEAAVSHASVSRSAVEFDWPECHRRGCQGRHGNVDSAFTTMKIQVMRAIRAELEHELTTKPDIAEPGDTPDQSAVYTLATLLNRYNVHHAGTFVKAAQLIVDAYPALIPAIADIGPPASATEAVEAEVAELLFNTRDYTWQIQARRVIELLKGKV